ncbi:xanthine dehydrogenase accessory factor [Virgisporangium aliadipatigenens]|uniref:Xanthine dehydrogenase accessory factor n=1 Tax=Virgisporangium aliadipatigenens TaxID=741659 RepID=A0A8J4DU94_9ACTN|nr:XdhC/CoxI family protein [Virgisporangium aliadipatigenens]GIJ50589.1 xanthine dehydrogenase accessory factor [Virgisporangium aliadipatigenens]
MRDVLEELLPRWSRGEPVGLATVTATWSSAPRQPGATMIVAADGTVAGSVSGGCVEAAVYELCREVAETTRARTVHFGVADDDAFEVGLPCGGTIELYVERVDRETFPELDRLADALRTGIPAALLTHVHDDGGHIVLTGEQRHGTLGTPGLDDAATADARGLLAGGRTALLRYGSDGERRGTDTAVLVTSFAPPARMLVFGANDHAAAVTRIGEFLGYRVTLCDARPVFATPRRFPHAHEVVVDWPQRYLAAEVAAGRIDARTVVCVLTHDPKFDVPLLELALNLPVAYVGAMGSRRTHDDRLARLRATGLSPAAIDRLASPIGLDLGARTPEETAVSIAAEITAMRWGGSGARLADTTGRIHA